VTLKFGPGGYVVDAHRAAAINVVVLQVHVTAHELDLLRNCIVLHKKVAFVVAVDESVGVVNRRYAHDKESESLNVADAGKRGDEWRGGIVVGLVVVV